MPSKTFSNLEVASFCDELSIILKSGISSTEGITILLEEASNKDEKETLQAILDSLMETGVLYDALESTNLYPSYMVHMIQIGEETGTLDEVLENLALHYQREDSIQSSIKNAIFYPAIMTFMMFVIVVVLLVKVMPIFNQVFQQLGSELTGISKTLLDIGNNLNAFAPIYLGIFALFLILVIYIFFSKKGKEKLLKWAYKFSITRKIYEESAACRFASGMALGIRAGLNPERSLELVYELNEDPLFGKKLDVCVQKMAEGEELSDLIHETKIFTGLYARMVSIGSKTGSLDKVLSKIAELYQEDIDAKMNSILATLEPTLVIILSVIVGVILCSVMLPLMGIMSSL